jgi:hypothetical protein
VEFVHFFGGHSGKTSFTSCKISNKIFAAGGKIDRKNSNKIGVSRCVAGSYDGQGGAVARLKIFAKKERQSLSLKCVAAEIEVGTARCAVRAGSRRNGGTGRSRNHIRSVA